ncbi:MAG: FKBP-type peptidyl-prolyl cis-trans isomerase, partial [Flavobacteriaceae bacterium]|nr:FKBP-type peptidyl-prolyl cis-trans isomerase [Flavobacteriaceae bacterium]
WLDNKHTVFGNVVEGQEVVDSIAQGDTMDSVEIIRVGAEAQNWNAVEAFRNFNGAKAEREAAAKKAQEELLTSISAGFEQTESGLRYQIIQKGNGAKAEAGKTVAVHYKGMFADGGEFDNSYKRGNPIEFPVGMGNVIAGWDEGIQLLKVGDKARFVIPSHLAYGSRGAGGVIPPNATLVFDVELMNVK